MAPCEFNAAPERPVIGRTRCADPALFTFLRLAGSSLFQAAPDLLLVKRNGTHLAGWGKVRWGNA